MLGALYLAISFMVHLLAAPLLQWVQHVQVTWERWFGVLGFGVLYVLETATLLLGVYVSVAGLEALLDVILGRVFHDSGQIREEDGT